MTAPRHVVTEPTDLGPAARELSNAGWRIHRGFAVPDDPWDLAPAKVVLAGPVSTEADARAALMAAVRGAGLLIHVDRGAAWAATFLADLSRLTEPSGVPERKAAPGLRSTMLTPEQRQILDLLAGGASIAQAARQLFWSLRTANRRVAAARDALGVTSTQEAVVAYSRLKQ